MKIDLPPRKSAGESIIPMINVVFLLLIFFLLTAQIAPSPPFELIPPESRAEQPSAARDVLYLSAEGVLAFNEARGDAVWPALTQWQGNGPLELHADAETPAADMVRALTRLRGMDGPSVNLVVGGG